MDNVYTYRLIGIKADGSDQIMNITASCVNEAEIIIESFHDGGYQLLSDNDFDWDALEQSLLEQEIAEEEEAAAESYRLEYEWDSYCEEQRMIEDQERHSRGFEDFEDEIYNRGQY